MSDSTIPNLPVIEFVKLNGPFKDSKVFAIQLVLAEGVNDGYLSDICVWIRDNFGFFEKINDFVSIKIDFFLNQILCFWAQHKSEAI